MEQSFSCSLCLSFCEGCPAVEHPFLNAFLPHLISQQTHLGCVGPVPRAGDKRVVQAWSTPPGAQSPEGAHPPASRISHPCLPICSRLFSSVPRPLLLFGYQN